MLKLEAITLVVLITSFAIKKKHALTVLLILEIYRLMIIVIVLTMGLELFFGLLLICIGACEGAVGLGTLVRMTRIIGKVAA